MRGSCSVPLLFLLIGAFQVMVTADGLGKRNVYHWPSPEMDWIDGVLYQQPFFDKVSANCSIRDNTTIAAQWIRLAFHDFSTHNVDDGTGGMDASIIYELDRAENIGMNRSIGDFLGFSTPFFSLADMFAAGLVIGTVSCDGPTIPYRAGRIDATSAGPLGVPQPQEDLALLTERFRKSGFSPTEMISLTACGHVLGGVTQLDFPDVLKDDAFEFFNNETRLFNNGVVTQYLDGTTPNPLVVGVNQTVNSDLRVFSSDGNVTMQSLASPDVFRSTCISLLERMIDTVPRDVTLTDVIDPFDFKVGQSRLSVSKDSDKLVMTTDLRILDPQGKANLNRSVNLVWVDRDGSSSCGEKCTSPAVNVSQIGTTLLTKGHGKTALQYTFTVDNIDPVQPIGKFWFEIDEKDGSGSSRRELKNDDGSGYVIEEHDVLYDVNRSQFNVSIDGSQNFTSLVVIAVKDEHAYAEGAKIHIKAFNPFVLPFRSTILEATLDPQFPKAAGYSFFSARPEPLANSFDVFYGDVVPENLRQKFGLIYEAKNVGVLRPSSS
ncbi:heme peroxidase [Marasmius fiardii PR-910]|nr:heme peroxidase [Marasmius fiardii PR-910]